MSLFILRCPYCYTSGDNVTEYSPENFAYCNKCKRSFSKSNEKHDLLHLLWTKAVHQPDYVKKVWQRLQVLIELDMR
jgi:hypothetical protein